MPAARNAVNQYSRRGLPCTGIRHFGQSSERGESRVPSPAASRIADGSPCSAGLFDVPCNVIDHRE